MKKVLALLLMVCVGVALAAPSTYSVLKLPAGSEPNMDGDVLGEWPIEYFIDSLHSDDNLYARDDGLPEWTRAMFQMQGYLAWDDSWVYFGVKVVADDDKDDASCAWNSDNLKINPGGQAMAFYICPNGEIKPNPSNPYTIGTTLIGAAIADAGDGLPSYEFKIDKALLDPFLMGLWQLSVGTEDQGSVFAAIGAEYTGNKQDWNGNPWDNPLYYPTYSLLTQEGPPMGIEGEVARSLQMKESISASPNPFMPTTTLSFTARQNGTIKIYDISGQLIDHFNTRAGTGTVNWNAKNLASGIYIARLTSGTQILNTRLFLTR
jgi:hypothetical protein